MKILITGAAGRLGSYMAGVLEKKHDLILTDMRLPKEISKHKFVEANLTDFKTVKKLCKDVDIVLHFAASAHKETPWEELLPNNIIGTRNVFEAASESNCKRVVFASSINAVNAYPEGKMIPSNIFPRPANIYGATKVWGEALASFYSDKKKLSILCIRFGRITEKDDSRIHKDYIGEKPFPSSDRIITYEDTAQLIEKCIHAPKKVKWGIFSGISDNKKKRLDISEAKKVLKYAPQYDAYKIAKKNKENLNS